MSYNETLILCMGLVFVGVIAAVVLSYRGLLQFQKNIILCQYNLLESYTLAGLSFTASAEGHPMTGPATLQQLAKLRESTGITKQVVVSEPEKPKTGVTVTQKVGV